MAELTKSWVLSLPSTVKRRGQGEMKSLARPCTSHQGWETKVLSSGVGCSTWNICLPAWVFSRRCYMGLGPS